MRQGKLPATVNAQCGTINHVDGQGTGRMNVDGSQCSRDSSRFIQSDEAGVEVLTCGHHLEKGRERVSQIEERL